MGCSICKDSGHNRRTCGMKPTNICEVEVKVRLDVRQDVVKVQLGVRPEPKPKPEPEPKQKPKNGMTHEEYNLVITEIVAAAKLIDVKKSKSDGRIDSALKENPFLVDLKTRLSEKYADWNIIIGKERGPYDIKINDIMINLKLTDCRSADNSVNKPAIYYSITGLLSYPYASTWNQFIQILAEAKKKNKIKQQRDRPTEYHYLVKNKLTGDVLLKSIFDIHTYVSNPSNDLQIKWKNEFEHRDYYTAEEDYPEKVLELMGCIQKSAKRMIKRTYEFAEADLANLFTLGPGPC